MRSLFPGHYPRSVEDLSKLWDEATFVIDTNSLLNLYRYRTDAREDFFRVLELVKDRLWIPYQVALEFHRRRLDVISAEKAAFDVANRDVETALSLCRKPFESSARNPHSTDEIKQALDAIATAAATIRSELNSQQERQLDIGQEDTILLRIEKLVGTRVGQPPTTEMLAQIASSGAARYATKVPPGYLDNKKEEIYVDRDLSYQARFGDLIIWRQIIDHARASGVKSVVFVSDDKKEDWWEIKSGKTLGPRPELVEEIQRDGGVDLFHMYSSDQFLRVASDRNLAQVSEESIEQVLEANAIQSNMEHVFDTVALSTDTGLKTVRAAVEMDLHDRFPDLKIRPLSSGDWIVQHPTNLFDRNVRVVRFANWKPVSASRVMEIFVELERSLKEELLTPELYVVVPKRLAEKAASTIDELYRSPPLGGSIRLGYIAGWDEDIFEPFILTRAFD